MMMQDFPGLSRVVVDLLLLAACLCLPPFQWGRHPGGRAPLRQAVPDAVLAE
jgi:hypothetical protein